jgi:hypothetical protein
MGLGLRFVVWFHRWRLGMRQICFRRLSTGPCRNGVLIDIFQTPLSARLEIISSALWKTPYSSASLLESVSSTFLFAARIPQPIHTLWAPWNKDLVLPPTSDLYFSRLVLVLLSSSRTLFSINVPEVDFSPKFMKASWKIRYFR